MRLYHHVSCVLPLAIDAVSFTLAQTIETSIASAMFIIIAVIQPDISQASEGLTADKFLGLNVATGLLHAT